ncbi:hypothetical protein [Parabacteroides johnsonii]|uniref:hypothetical protein n=1 Tax=Parabacteroides johnsonii TaxID=387661 RepID=UPI001899BEB0|nr:hypothetical protein [Parabacteroides johnsonii]
MIQAVPNPKMTKTEVENFRREFRRIKDGRLTPEEKKMVAERVARMKKTAEIFISNNGEKNPILGY